MSVAQRNLEDWVDNLLLVAWLYLYGRLLDKCYLGIFFRTSPILV